MKKFFEMLFYYALSIYIYIFATPSNTNKRSQNFLRALGPEATKCFWAFTNFGLSATQSGTGKVKKNQSNHFDRKV